MALKTWIAAVAAAALLPMMAWAEPGAGSTAQPTSQPSARASELIAQLGNGTFQSRKHAEEQLVQMGAAVEPALKDAAEHSASAEIRARAAAAVTRIDELIAIAPTYITLHVKAARPGDVLRDIARQAKVKISGVPIQYWGDHPAANIPPITLDLDRVPFWSAMQALCAATHSHPLDSLARPDGYSLLIGGNSVANWDVHGRFAVIPTAITHNTQVDLLGAGPTTNDGIALEVLLDPRIHGIDWDPPQITSAVDELGNSLIPSGGASGPIFFPPGYQRTSVIPTTIPLVFPPHFGKTLTKLEGSITLRMPREFATLKIPDLEKAVGAGVSAGNLKVDVIGCTFGGGNAAKVHLHVSKLKGDIYMPGGIMQAFEDIRVTDSAGQRLLLIGGGSGDGMQFDWQGTLQGRGPLKPPFSLEWKAVAGTESATVPFTFTDLPLPPP